MKKKILSIILSVVMIVTFVPKLTAKAGTIITVKSETFKSNKDDDTSVRQQFPDGEYMSAGQQHFNDGNSHTIAGEFRGSDDTDASDWAIDEIESAIDNDLVTDAVTYDYQANITREEFCELVVLLYEKLTDTTAAVGSDVFYDTSNRSVRKAYNLGIVNGVSSDRFAPDNFITRQEICAMLVRAIGVIYTGIDLDDYDYTSFADSYSISSWAMDAVQFAYDNDIMRGVGNGKINPLGNTTCEQAILLVNRIYENRRDFESMDEDNRERLAKENEKNKVKTLSLRNDDEVEAISVTFDDGRNASSVKIKEVTDDDDMIYTTTGILGSAVDITYSKRFDGATISFEYNEEGLGDVNPSDLAIGWYNTDLDRVEILSSRVDTYSHTVSVETTHFSRYILVDSKEWYSVWQKGQMIVRETDKNGNYAEDFNVQLVVDCSGSMDGDRIVKARECTLEFINKLSLYDMFSVIKFGSEAVTVIDPVSILDANMDEVEQVVMSLSDGGGTNFDNALRECINGLKSSNVDYDDYNNIIVFLSDGGSEVSDSLLEELSDKGIRIAAVALGSGSDSERMKHLSDSTNGQYIYAESSEALDTIFDAIQGSLIGVDATDTDGDGIPDIIEVTGMKNQYGAVIRTDPYEYDTDGDGDSDGEEMGSLVETDEVTDMDRANGITKNVYFQMVSNPLDGVRDTDFKLDDERTLGKFSGLPGHLTLTAGDEHWIELNRANAKLSIDDESIATIEPGIDVGNIDGTVSNWTNFKICPKESGEATLTATAPNGQKLKCKLTVNAKVELKAESSGIDDTGHFTLTFHLDTVGTSKKLYVEFVCAECISWWMAHDEYNFTDHNGKIYKPTLAEGNYDVTVDMTCLVGESGADCDNSHDVTAKVYGDNFEPQEFKVTNWWKKDNIVVDDDNEVDNGAMTREKLLAKLENLEPRIDEYLSQLYKFQEDKFIEESDALKSQTEKENAIRKKINDKIMKTIQLPQIFNSGTSDQVNNIQTSLKICIENALFDFYMARAINDSSSDEKTNYFDNISPGDFSNGGIDATVNITKDCKKFVKELLDDNKLKSVYKSGSYSFQITVALPLGNSAAIGTILIEEYDEQKKKPTCKEEKIVVSLDETFSDIQEATDDFIYSLCELGKTATKGAIKAAFADLKKELTITDENGFIKPMTAQKIIEEHPFKKTIDLTKETVEVLKANGFGEVDKFLGECINICDKINDQKGRWRKLIESSKEGDIEKFYDAYKKECESIDSLAGELSGIDSLKEQRASEILIKKAQKAIIDLLNEILQNKVQ